MTPDVLLEPAPAVAAPRARAADEVPWLPVEPLDAAAFSAVRRRAIFDCCKWDPQVEDVCTIARFPLVLRASAWRELARMAERLAAETLAAEAELVARPELHARLGLPRRMRAALRRAARDGASVGAARLIRFDFHWTRAGWRISEANSDVPGGLNEASGFARLFAPHYPGTTPVGDTAGDYADAVLRAAGRRDARVALVHATAYTDDRQVMTYVARELEARGARTLMTGPADVAWRDGRAFVRGSDDTIDVVVRFFPSEWLTDLARANGWEHFYSRASTPLSNPATAALTQTKRFPLVWDALATPLPAWRALLPETRDPRAVDWRTRDDWLVKPALGRVGADVGMRDVVTAKEWRAISRHARWFPGQWIAQRRFDAVPLDVDGTRAYPCVGVYTVDGRAAGAYGRIATRPLIDWHAQDIAILKEGTDA